MRVWTPRLSRRHPLPFCCLEACVELRGINIYIPLQEVYMRFTYTATWLARTYNHGTTLVIYPCNWFDSVEYIVLAVKSTMDGFLYGSYFHLPLHFHVCLDSLTHTHTRTRTRTHTHMHAISQGTCLKDFICVTFCYFCTLAQEAQVNHSISIVGQCYQ